MKTVGLCMIVKNEAAIIERCLDSVRPLVDFVLIEDTGSTDGTQQVIKDWMHRHDLPGQVFDEPWRDFSYNRTRALEELRKNGAIDYALIMDADDFIVYADGFDAAKFKSDLSHDQYAVELREPSIRYDRPQLCRNALPFRYRGVLHEFLETPPGANWGRASGFHIASRREGARSRDPDKYRNDAAVLESALRDEKEPHLRARYMFYLGQSYRDCGEKEKAAKAFLARAEQGLWNQEVYLSLYYTAQLREALKHPFDEVFTTYQRAIAVLPERAEARHGACRLCRNAGRSREGYEIGKPGLSLTPPNGLFIETWIYDFGLLDEFSINAFWAGHYREALDAGLRLLGENRFPAHERGRIVGNARFAVGKLQSGDAGALDLMIARTGHAPPPPPQLALPTGTAHAAKKPPVSIITPTGGRAPFLAQALRHFRNQDYPDLEWLILDDSPEPNKAFTELRDPKIHYRHHTGSRLTIGAKRNRLAAQARGEIIVQFDDDDFYAPHYVTRMVEALLANDADLINLRGWHLYDQRSDFYGYWDLMQKEGLHYRCGWRGLSVIMLNSGNNQELTDNHLGFGFSYAFKKIAWQQSNFSDTDFNEDGLFALAIAAKGKVVGCHDTEGMCLHVLHPNSTSRCFPQYRLPNFQLAAKFPGFDPMIRIEAKAEPAAKPEPRARETPPARPGPIPKSRRPAVAAPPVFIHSSWRSSSTWFWSKFRELPETTAYFEPFCELNAFLTPANVVPFGPDAWESRHPKTDSYLLEYTPLLRRSVGIRLYQPPMAFEWFIPPGGLEGGLRREELRYIALLVRHAMNRGRVPVLGFVRSLGRVAAIRKHFDGVHILQTRNLWLQWQSFVSYKRRRNMTFYDTVPQLFTHVGADPFLTSVRDRYLNPSDPAPAARNAAATTSLLKALPEPDMFALFMALHVYLFLHAERCVDVVVDVTRMAHEPDYWAATAQKLRSHCRLPVSLGDVSDERQPDDREFDLEAVDWQAIRKHGREAATILSGSDDAKPLARRADDLIDAAFAEAKVARDQRRRESGPKKKTTAPAPLATAARR
ncbi:MAG TPA: glycosyltransferase [Stellaceae bacterium]|jgi:glycosyltransferase involved in cell wall biosynthesis